MDTSPKKKPTPKPNLQPQVGRAASLGMSWGPAYQTQACMAEVRGDGLSATPSLLLVSPGDGAPGSLEQCRELPAITAKSFAVRKRAYVSREQNKHKLDFGVKHWFVQVKLEQLPSLRVLLCSFLVLLPLPPAPVPPGCW